MLISALPTTIAIVGAGFSGSLVAVHLLKTADRPLQIKLIDRNPGIAQGVAYSTTTASHLLNVPAGKMSAFADDPDHLLRWLHRHCDELAAVLPNDVQSHCFIPRLVYRLYLQSVLKEAEAIARSDVQLEHMVDEVMAIKPQHQGAVLTLRNRQIVADLVVLAIGNTAAAASTFADNFPDLRDAWSIDALTDLEPDAPVLLVGTGLTMVDAVLSLRERQHRGQIYAVSRRGLLPRAHGAAAAIAQNYPSFLTPKHAPKTVRGLMQRIRSEVQGTPSDWQSVIDALRPFTQQLWQQLPADEQRRFLRHAHPYWDVHRHRIAPEIAQMIQAMQKSGQMKLMAGRIQRYRMEADHVAVQIRQRHTGSDLVLPVSRVINCTGVRIDYRHATQPLIANLRDQGLIRPHGLGLGLETTANGTVLDGQGHRSAWLYTLGTPRRGDLWETTAVPELRQQAQAIAATLLQSLPAPAPIIPIAPHHVNGNPQSALLFRQFFDPESSTYTYLIADNHTKEAVLVDPVLEQVERDLQIINELGLTLRYCLETHIHADHITGAGQLRRKTGCQVIVPQYSQTRSADRTLSDGEILKVGSVPIAAIATPGHTNSHLAYLVSQSHLLTGDALLIRGCGRTDLQFNVIRSA